jgi:hypothetical protein
MLAVIKVCYSCFVRRKQINPKLLKLVREYIILREEHARILNKKKERPSKNNSISPLLEHVVINTSQERKSAMPLSSSNLEN